MSQEKYIAAIEIGSSKIIGAVGRYNRSGRLDVIAVEQEHAQECVCHGLIHNVEDTASRISRIITRLENRTGVSPRKINKVYVGLSGRSLRNVPREITRNLPEDTEITEDLLKKMAEDARHSQIDASLEVIEAIPAKYYVNKTETKSPAGTFGNNIKVIYQLIAARPLLRRHLMRVIEEKVGIKVAGIVVTQIAVGDLILSADERRLGCMLVDMGAETTTVSIYQQGALHYLAVLPMGSRNITQDITSLSVIEEEAEDVKTASGNAIPQDNPSSLNINGMRLSDVSNLVVARSEELVANIIEQLSYAGVSSNRIGSIVTIGGGFNLNRMSELLRRQSALKVRRGTLPDFVTLEDTKAPTYETIEVIGIMNAGTYPSAPECMELPVRVELPKEPYDGDDADDPTDDYEGTTGRQPSERNKKVRSKLGWLKKKLADFVSAPEDDDSEIE